MKNAILFFLAMLCGSANACDISLTWTEPVQDADVVIGKISNYNVYRCTKSDCSDAVYVKQVPMPAMTTLDTGRPTGSWYYYVQRITTAPDQSSNIVLKSCADPVVPPKPKGPLLSSHVPTRPKSLLAHDNRPMRRYA